MALHPKPAVYYLCVLQYSFSHQTSQAIIFNSLNWHLLHDFNSKCWLIWLWEIEILSHLAGIQCNYLHKRVQLMKAEVYKVLNYEDLNQPMCIVWGEFTFSRLSPRAIIWKHIRPVHGEIHSLLGFTYSRNPGSRTQSFSSSSGMTCSKLILQERPASFVK